MLIAITEHNSWENERWSYILDLSKQDGDTIDKLMIFVRVANKFWERVKEEAPQPSGGFLGIGPKIFAAAKYIVRFFNSVEVEKDDTFIGINKNSRMHFNGRNNYKSGGVYLDTVISPRRMKAAMEKMRDKEENLLYKNFEYIFLSSKKVKNETAHI